MISKYAEFNSLLYTLLLGDRILHAFPHHLFISWLVKLLASLAR